MEPYREYLMDDFEASASGLPFIPGFVLNRLNLQRWREDFYEVVELQKMPFLKAFFDKNMAILESGKDLPCLAKEPETFPSEFPLDRRWRQWTILHLLLELRFAYKDLPITPKELEPYKDKFRRLKNTYSLRHIHLPVPFPKILIDVDNSVELGYSTAYPPNDDLAPEERPSRVLVDAFMTSLFEELQGLCKKRFSVGRDRALRILLGEIARYKGLVKSAFYFYHQDGRLDAMLDGLQNPSHIIVKFVKASILSIIEDGELKDISKNNFVKLITLYKEEILDTEDIVQVKDKTALLIAEVLDYLRNPA